MQNITLTKVNQKGQVVIPVKLRKELGINAQTYLSVMSYGDAVVIKPIKRVVTEELESKSALLDLLKQTQGSWSDTKESIKVSRNRRRLEKKKVRELKEMLW